MRRLLVLALVLGTTSCGDDSAGPGDSNQLVVGALLIRPGVALEATPAQALPSGREIVLRYVAAIGGSAPTAV